MATDVTSLLRAMRRGDLTASEELFQAVMKELHRTASRLLRGERDSHTLHTTDLVHEAYLRLVNVEHQGSGPDDWQDRAHFLSTAALAMRHILVDHARRRNRAKREGDREKVPLESALLVMYETSAGVDIELLHKALTELAEIRTRAAQIIDMRFFADMTVEQIAYTLDVSVSTVEREWRYARAWLKDALSVSIRAPRRAPPRAGSPAESLIDGQDGRAEGG